MHPITTKNVENTDKTSLTSNKHDSHLTGLQEINHSTQFRKDLAYRISTTSVYKYGNYG